MNIKHSLLAGTVGICMGAAVASADTIIVKEPQVRTIVTEAGYGEPLLIQREGDLWRVKSTDKNGNTNVTLFVDQQGNVLGAADVARTRVTQTTTTTETTTSEPGAVASAPQEFVTEAAVASIVADAGFHNIHDIDFLDNRGVWKAEADDVTGEDFEVHVDAMSGNIVHVEDD